MLDVLQIIEAILGWIERGIPEAVTHTCGPESNCDHDCQVWAHYCKDLKNFKLLVRNLKKKSPQCGGAYDTPWKANGDVACYLEDNKGRILIWSNNDTGETDVHLGWGEYKFIEACVNLCSKYGLEFTEQALERHRRI